MSDTEADVKKSFIYVLTVTEYEDDFKHRYDNGIYPKSPMLFKKRETAEKWILEHMREKTLEMANDQYNDESDLPKKYKKYLKYEKGKDWQFTKAGNKLDAEDLRENFHKGEYADYVIDWELDEEEVIDD